jgi:hypothetical protein
VDKARPVPRRQSPIMQMHFAKFMQKQYAKFMQEDYAKYATLLCKGDTLPVVEPLLLQMNFLAPPHLPSVPLLMLLLVPPTPPCPLVQFPRSPVQYVSNQTPALDSP